WEHKANPASSLNAVASRTPFISTENGAKWRRVIFQAQVELFDVEVFDRTRAATRRGLESATLNGVS
ncbi:hypothetical protein H0H93_004462, partial [Arthromyces matolae]